MNQARMTLLMCGVLATGSAWAASTTGVVLETKYVHKKRSFSGMTEQKGEITITLGAEGVRTESPKVSKVIETFTFDKGKEISYYMNRNNKTYELRDMEKRRQEDAALEAARASRPAGGPPGTGLFGGSLRRIEENRPKGEVKTLKTGKKVTIAGYSCEYVRFTQQGELVGEVWIATKFKKLRSTDALKTGIKLLAENSEGKENKEMLAARLALKGVELKLVVHRPAGQSYTIEATKVTEKTVPASSFKPATGFKQVDSVRLFGKGS